MGYCLLRLAGMAHVKYFPAGWSEWVSDESRPTVRFISGDELKILVGREQRWPWADSPMEAFVFLDVRHEWWFHALGVGLLAILLIALYVLGSRVSRAAARFAQQQAGESGS